MVTFAVEIAFLGVLTAWWMRYYADFPRLARKYLWLAPFLPLVSLLNHNLDQDSFGTFFRLFPIYVALALLATSCFVWSYRERRARVGAQEICLVAYLVLSLVQTLNALDPRWSLSAWAWTVPGYVLFLIAGKATSVEDLEEEPGFFYAVFAYIAVNLSLIGYGLLTGRASDLFFTRNFGSIYASTAMLNFLTLFAGLAWIALRRRPRWRIPFLLGSLLAVAMSLSRTAAFVVILFGLLVFFDSSLRRRWAVSVGAVALAGFLLAAVSLIPVEVGGTFLTTWASRFNDGSVLVAFVEARELRLSEFGQYREMVFRANPFYGHGFGMFREYSEYADAHDLFVTEAFENGLIAAIFLFLAFRLPLVARRLAHNSLRPIALSIAVFLVIAELTGGVLSYRAPGSYYGAFPGWTLMFLTGMLTPAERSQAT